MKKIFCIAVMIPSLVAAQDRVAGFRITGNVRGLAEKSKVFLTDANNPSDTVARANVKGGVFILTGRVAEPNLFELNYFSAKKKSLLFIGNDQVKVEGNIEDIKNLHFSGSQTQEEFLDFQKEFNPYFTRLNALVQLANSPAGSGKSDSISREYASTVMNVQTAIDQFIASRKSSPVSAFVLVAAGQLSEDAFLLEKRYNSLT